MVAVKFNVGKIVFFDRAVAKSISPRTRRALSKFGAFTRTRARSSIRNGRKTSRPGRPPTNRTGTLRRGIMFGLDTQRETVVIGPKLFAGKKRGILEGLETGGTTPRADGTRQRVDARPFMLPAYKAELPNAPKLWKS
jgi:hypothetical protein